MWGDCSPSAIIDCQMVQPALNPFLADVPGIQALDGSEMLEVDRAMMRDLPYSEPTLLPSCALVHENIDTSSSATPAKAAPRLQTVHASFAQSRKSDLRGCL